MRWQNYAKRVCACKPQNRAARDVKEFPGFLPDVLLCLQPGGNSQTLGLRKGNLAYGAPTRNDHG